jgi:hypothetical protein
MQTSEQECFASQSDNSRSPPEKDENRACLYSVRPFASVIQIQAKIQVLCTSSPQQFLRKILKANESLLQKQTEEVRQGLAIRQNRVDLRRVPKEANKK